MEEKLYINNGNIMYVYNIMKKYSDIEHPIKISKIIELIEQEYDVKIGRKTIIRDFKVLMEKFDITIENVNNAYYMDYEENDFEPSEIRCMVDMVNYSRFVDENTAKALTVKLVNQLNENDKKEFVGYEKYMKDSKTANKEVFYTIKTVSEAIHNKKMIGFEYYKYNLKKELEFRKHFSLSPISIICEIGEYYLIACDETKELRYYRLDRMKKIKLEDKKAVTISQKQLNDYIQSSIGMFGGEKEMIEAIVNNCLLDDAIESFGKEVQIAQYDKESFRMRAEVNLRGFKNWALRHLEDAEVVKPEKLKVEIQEVLEKSMRKYEK